MCSKLTAANFKFTPRYCNGLGMISLVLESCKPSENSNVIIKIMNIVVVDYLEQPLAWVIIQPSTK